MDFVIENLRLKELVLIVRRNKPFYDDFIAFLKAHGYGSLLAFINEASDDQALKTLVEYLKRTSPEHLLDGLGRPYAEGIARFYFLSWVLRDAPAQRLQPLLSQMPGRTLDEKRAALLNEIRKHTAPLFPCAENWSWNSISEVMLARLEGSRRALKGALFEGIVRTQLRDIFNRNGLNLEVGNREVKINDETYDVEVRGPNGRLLLPVKTRETMGGGHANLFTRDIHKSISVAEESGYHCIPIVIAESWGGDLGSLKCENYIYIKANPNQVVEIEPVLRSRLEEMVPVFTHLQA